MKSLKSEYGHCRHQMVHLDVPYDYFSLEALARELGDFSRLPYSLKIILENLLRHEDGRSTTGDHIRSLAGWLEDRRSAQEIAYRPARVLMQDFTGVPALVDMAAMRQAMMELGGDPSKINPLLPVDLVIDHSVQVDKFGQPNAFKSNTELEYERNNERFAFLRWGAEAFDNFRVVPPGTGICHQVNLEHLSQVVWISSDGNNQLAYPDTLVGTDSHTTMVNGLGVLGWGVGGIEAEAAMLGQPMSMLMPDVIGFRLDGELPSGTVATDLVLTVTQMLRAKGVVGKFVEFFGPGLDRLPVADRATIANMAPEYGATSGMFPVDRQTIDYLELTGRDPERISLVETYAKAQGMWREPSSPNPIFSDTIELDMSTVEPSLAGPKRPQDRVPLSSAKQAFDKAMPDLLATADPNARMPLDDMPGHLTHGDVVIAAITSCTNTSNPAAMIGAGLVARKAHERGLKRKPYVKTSLAPGSSVVTGYLRETGLMSDLEAIGFDLVGYGCTTCNGNSGPLPEPVASAIDKGELVATAVLSGNRNFEGRVHPQVKANYLASPALVVAYALAGSLRSDLTKDQLGEDRDGKPVYLRDIWPKPGEVDQAMRAALTEKMFRDAYGNAFRGDARWAEIAVGDGELYDWEEGSTYVRLPPYFQDFASELPHTEDIIGAKAIAVLGDSVTTDHISPVGSIAKTSPAAAYLMERQVSPSDFNSYGSRRGNHEVMMRGTFANIRLRNELAPGTEGGWTRIEPDGEELPVYDAAMRYQNQRIPMVVIGGKDYGMGSSRDWAAKGTRLLGVKAVIAESFERIHRANLVSMGVLPLMFTEGMTRKMLGLDGSETFDLVGISGNLKPRSHVNCTVRRADGAVQSVTLLCLIETLNEVDYYRHGGILFYMLRKLSGL